MLYKRKGRRAVGERALSLSGASESPTGGDATGEIRFPTNYAVLLTGPPGVGKFEYTVARMREALRLGERVVCVTLDLHPSEVRARAKALGLDLDAAEGKSFVFVDCYSATSSERPEPAPGKKTFLVSSFSNLEGIGMAMSKAAQELGTPVRIFFYTISTLFLHNSTQAIAKFFQIVTGRAKQNMGFILYSVHDGVHEPMTMNLLRSLVDGVVEMRFTEAMDREMRVHHMRGFAVNSAWRPFTEMPGAPGGI
ncbi:MAG TPA: RAD55 family ATPase [Thermoplasmata archaeon]